MYKEILEHILTLCGAAPQEGTDLPGVLVAAFIRAASEHKEKEVRALAKEFIKEIKEEEMPMCPPRTLSVGGSAP